MRLIESVVEERSDGIVCRVVIDDRFVFLRDGTAEIAVCMELVAQAVGCCVGLEELRRGEEPRGGLLVGCRQADFAPGRLHAGDELLVTVEKLWVREPIASFSGEVTRVRRDPTGATTKPAKPGEAGEQLASVELSVVHGLSPEAYERAREL